MDDDGNELEVCLLGEAGQRVKTAFDDGDEVKVVLSPDHASIMQVL